MRHRKSRQSSVLPLLAVLMLALGVSLLSISGGAMRVAETSMAVLAGVASSMQAAEAVNPFLAGLCLALSVVLGHKLARRMRRSRRRSAVSAAPEVDSVEAAAEELPAVRSEPMPMQLLAAPRSHTGATAGCTADDAAAPVEALAPDGEVFEEAVAIPASSVRLPVPCEALVDGPSVESKQAAEQVIAASGEESGSPLPAEATATESAPAERVRSPRNRRSLLTLPEWFRRPEPPRETGASAAAVLPAETAIVADAASANGSADEVALRHEAISTHDAAAILQPSDAPPPRAVSAAGIDELEMPRIARSLEAGGYAVDEAADVDRLRPGLPALVQPKPKPKPKTIHEPLPPPKAVFRGGIADTPANAQARPNARGPLPQRPARAGFGRRGAIPAHVR